MTASSAYEFVNQVKAMGIQQVLSAPRSPWQRAYIERLIGSIRRECLDHFIVFNERTLKRHLSAYVAYYHTTRTHLALQKDCPETRPLRAVDVGPDREVTYSLVACIIAISVGSPANLNRLFHCQRDPIVYRTFLYRSADDVYAQEL